MIRVEQPAVLISPALHIVHLLAKRPELRDVFPAADALDIAVRAGA